MTQEKRNKHDLWIIVGIVVLCLTVSISSAMPLKSVLSWIIGLGGCWFTLWTYGKYYEARMKYEEKG